MYGEPLLYCIVTGGKKGTGGKKRVSIVAPPGCHGLVPWRLTFVSYILLILARAANRGGEIFWIVSARHIVARALCANWTEWEGHKRQKPFKGYLLRDIPLTVFYPLKGMIDLGATFDESQRQELERLEAWIERVTSQMERVEVGEFLKNVIRCDELAHKRGRTRLAKWRELGGRA